MYGCAGFWSWMKVISENPCWWNIHTMMIVRCISTEWKFWIVAIRRQITGSCNCPKKRWRSWNREKILSLCIVTTGWLPVIWTSVCGRNKSTNRFLLGLQHKLLPMWCLLRLIILLNAEGWNWMLFLQLLYWWIISIWCRGRWIMLPIRLLLPTGNRMRWEYISRRLPSGRNTAFFSLYNVSWKRLPVSICWRPVLKNKKSWDAGETMWWSIGDISIWLVIKVKRYRSESRMRWKISLNRLQLWKTVVIRLYPEIWPWNWKCWPLLRIWDR